jgi:hypothetical protein
MGVGVQRHAPAALPPGKTRYPIGQVWTGAENFAPTEIRSSDRPARSESLYRLSYPGHDVKERFIYHNISVFNLEFLFRLTNSTFFYYKGADKSLARPGSKQATATEDFDVHISYL